jgi:hypothetical protein
MEKPRGKRHGANGPEELRDYEARKINRAGAGKRLRQGPRDRDELSFKSDTAFARKSSSCAMQS